MMRTRVSSSCLKASSVNFHSTGLEKPLRLENFLLISLDLPMVPKSDRVYISMILSNLKRS